MKVYMVIGHSRLESYTNTTFSTEIDRTYINDLKAARRTAFLNKKRGEFYDWFVKEIKVEE